MKMFLDQHLNRRLARHQPHYLTRRTNGRAFRPPNYLAEACRALNGFLRQQKKMARTSPHLFGPHARRYYLDTIQLAREDADAEAAIRKVYGPPQPGDPPRGPGVWTQRYFLDPQWKKFPKWLREQYDD